MTYTFTTDDPIEAQRIMKSLDMAIAISKIRNIKHSYKHREDLTRGQRKILEEINDTIVQICEDIDIDNLLL